MATRRESREWALQLLFELDMNPRDPERAFEAFWSERQSGAKPRKFTEDLVRGVRTNLEAIDSAIRKYAEHWDLRRMGVIERNVMRLAIYEILFCKDIPPVVSINEAVDLAQYFSSRESGKFVNGILDRVRKETGRPARTRGAA
jgi:N utilization substance protein B